MPGNPTKLERVAVAYSLHSLSPGGVSNEAHYVHGSALRGADRSRGKNGVSRSNSVHYVISQRWRLIKSLFTAIGKTAFLSPSDDYLVAGESFSKPASRFLVVRCAGSARPGESRPRKHL